MPRHLLLICFILALPAFAALGHDLWFAYYADEEQRVKTEALDIDPKIFRLSDLGYLWVTYSQDTLIQMRDTIGVETWKRYIDPVLEQKAVLVGLALPAGVFVITMFFWVLGLWPFNRRSGGDRSVKVRKTGSGNDMYDSQNKGKYKYSRK